MASDVRLQRGLRALTIDNAWVSDPVHGGSKTFFMGMHFFFWEVSPGTVVGCLVNVAARPRT